MKNNLTKEDILPTSPEGWANSSKGSKRLSEYELVGIHHREVFVSNLDKIPQNMENALETLLEKAPEHVEAIVDLTHSLSPLKPSQESSDEITYVIQYSGTAMVNKSKRIIERAGKGQY